MTKLKVICKYDNLPMTPEHGSWSGELYYRCKSKGAFALHLKERLVRVADLPEKTQNHIFKPKAWPLGKKTIRI